MKKSIQLYALLLLPTVLCAAEPVDLAKLSGMEFLKKRLAPEKNMQELSRTYDSNQTLHVRFQQLFNGYPVWGADGVFHYPKQDKKSLVSPTGNGKVYKDLDQDLAVPPQYIFTAAYQQKVELELIKNYQAEKGKKIAVNEKKSAMLIFVDKQKNAHWAFLVKLFVKSKPHLSPDIPCYIVDAVTLQVYQKWNDLKTMDEVFASGYGGNQNTGKYIYDGLKDNLPPILISRKADTNMCYMKNKEFSIDDHSSQYETISFPCSKKDEQHNNTYWHDELTYNGGYSRSHDVLYHAMIVIDMYRQWYQLEISGGEEKKLSLPMSLNINEDIENAYFDPYHHVFSFGNGGKDFYPLTSLDVVAHELSHAVTHFTSKLVNYGQAAAINESFSDMAAKAAAFYTNRPIIWDIGSDVNKDKKPFRYMIEPSTDCHGWPAGFFCSIDRAEQYGVGLMMSEHHAAGVFNRFFYILSTSPNWNIKKAFDVMVQANRHYWTSEETFQTAACGVWRASKDLIKNDANYEIDQVRWAFREVGIETDDCV